jgi:hypothetical protein
VTSVIAWGQYVCPSNVFQPPGNSLRAIDLAFAYGFNGIELDLQLTKDGELVLMHDNTLDRTTLGTGPVSEQTTEQLARVELRDPWQGVPCYVATLTTALERVGSRGFVMLDMHHVVPRTVAAVQRSVMLARFNPSCLLLLTYDVAGGLLYKAALPGAVVLRNLDCAPSLPRLRWGSTVFWSQSSTSRNLWPTSARRPDHSE